MPDKLDSVADDLYKTIEMYVDKRFGKLMPLLEEIQKQLAASPSESFERRLSRHAEHLARHEDRLKKGGL